MIIFPRTEKCKDCGKEVYGYFYGNEELILCSDCERDFKNWIRKDPSRTYCLSFHEEYISENGNRQERESRFFNEHFSEPSATIANNPTGPSNVELISRVMRSSADHA